MTTKLVLRVLDAEGHLLGWEAHEARARGDGILRADGPVMIPIDQDGMPAVLSVHWADVNVETRVPMPATPLRRGMCVPAYTHDAPMVALGQMPGPLPAVTLRGPVAVGIPVGQVGSATSHNLAVSMAATGVRP